LIGALARPVRGLVKAVGALPAVIDAILVLPTLSRQLDEVRADTQALHEVVAELRRVRGDTAALPVIEAELARLSGVAVPLQGAAVRFGRLADRWPQRRRSALAGGDGDGPIAP
jgi:hypothetical protein